jgi:NAD+ synthase (glutamine-hydrolysing)
MSSYVYANLLGNESGRVIFDGGALIASEGKLIAAGPRFSFADHVVTTAVIDVEATRMSQARTASFEPALNFNGLGSVSASFHFPRIEPAQRAFEQSGWETATDRKEEEFTRAVALGLYDYLRKSRSNGFVVSLSGGADSSAVACLVSLMVKLGIADVGFPAFVSKLSYIPKLSEVGSGKELVRGLLTCVYQASANSSETTRNAAQTVANLLHAEYLEFDISLLVDQYVNMVSRGIDRNLSWDDDDLALQNIQARVRGPGVWLLANLKSALLLTTSNRSEAAVGYATMDGDTCGGLSPIAGIDKAFLRCWLVWLQKIGPHGLEPIPALAAVNCQPPTAELRPSQAGQTDEDDLMPYLLLDAIERAAIRDKKTPLEVFVLMQVQFAEYNAGQLRTWVERFFRLWCRNQWKRERYAPSFHLDDENLDPKTWCRFPILSGNFETELVELREYVVEQAKPERSSQREEEPVAALLALG